MRDLDSSKAHRDSGSCRNDSRPRIAVSGWSAETGRKQDEAHGTRPARSQKQRRSKMNNYKYDHIIHLLLNKHGWVRVPWFVSLQEKPDAS